MMGLWADGWFYISSAGLLVSGILFFFLLGQYRVASEAADVSEGEQGADKETIASHAPIRPVYIPDDEAPAARVASHAAPEPVKADPNAGKDTVNTTGGISPAVVYLQNIKGELADLHGDLRALAKRVDDELSAVSARDEALIERLSELTRAVEGMKAAAPETPAPKKARKEKAPEAEPPAVIPPLEADAVVLAPAPEPEPAPAPEPAPEPAAESVTEQVPEPKTEPVRSADETIRMELGALVAQTPAEPEKAAEEPAPAAKEPPPEEKTRRGPVWPV